MRVIYHYVLQSLQYCHSNEGRGGLDEVGRYLHMGKHYSNSLENGHSLISLQLLLRKNLLIFEYPLF